MCRRAFTLIELLVVMVVLSICVVVVLPKFPSTQSLRMNRCVQHLTNTARAAQNLAIASQGYCTLHLNLSEGHYWLTLASAEGTKQPLSEGLGDSQHLGQGIQFDQVRIDDTLCRSGREASFLFGPEGPCNTGMIALAVEGEPEPWVHLVLNTCQMGVGPFDIQWGQSRHGLR